MKRELARRPFCPDVSLICPQNDVEGSVEDFDQVLKVAPGQAPCAFTAPPILTGLRHCLFLVERAPPDSLVCRFPSPTQTSGSGCAEPPLSHHLSDAITPQSLLAVTHPAAALRDAFTARRSCLFTSLFRQGLSLYYLERYADGAVQFRKDVAVNPNDTEESIWAFLCGARWSLDWTGVELLNVNPGIPLDHEIAC